MMYNLNAARRLLALQVASPLHRAAGCLFICPSKSTALVGLRSKRCDMPHTWATFGGGVDGEETPEEALCRELMEEAQYKVNTELKLYHISHMPKLDYYNYLSIVPGEFKPILNDETADYAWTGLDDIMSMNLHPGFDATMQQYEALIRGYMGQ